MRQDIAAVGVAGWSGRSMLLPAVVLMAIVALAPVLVLLDMLLAAAPDAGGVVRLLQVVLQDGPLLEGALAQILLAVSAAIAELALGLLVGLAMPRRGAAGGIVLVLVALPLVLPDQASALALLQLLQFLPAAHADMLRSTWLPPLALEVWHWTPMVALLVHAACRTVPESLHHAARADGLRGWRAFRWTTWPCVRRALVVALVIRVLGGLVMLTAPLVLKGGGLALPGPLLGDSLAALVQEGDAAGRAAAAALLYLFLTSLVAFIGYRVLVPYRSKERQA